MTKLFGTDGIRGKANIFPLDETSMELLGYTLGTIIGGVSGNQPEVIIGYDTRESSINIFESISRGFNKCKGKIMNAGTISTPVVSFLASYFKQYAIAITASHNPYEDNGIKIFAPGGLKLSEDKEYVIEEGLLRRNIFQESTSFAPLIIDINQRAYELYYEELIRKNFPALDLQGMHIAIDVAHGAGYHLIPCILGKLGGTIIIHNNTPNGKNINHQCGALHPEYLSQCILNTDINPGISYDGDADRAIFSDNTGKIYDGDMILAIIGLYLKGKGLLKNNTIIATIMSNYGLEKYLISNGIHLVRVPVGDKYVLEKMMELKVNLGGEQSGHIILSDLLKTGDGLLTTLMILSIMKELQCSLHEMIKGFERFPQILVNVKTKNKVPIENIPELFNAYNEILHKLQENGRIIIRYSGTEPLLRIMIEGHNYQEISAYAEMLSSIAHKHLS